MGDEPIEEEPIEELRELEKLIGTEATEQFLRETVDTYFGPSPQEASEEERQNIARLCREGKVEAKDPSALDSMLDAINTGKEPDWNVTKVELESSFGIHWATVSAGFGEVVFYLKDGKPHCDSEGMSKQFVMSVLAKLVDSATFN